MACLLLALALRRVAGANRDARLAEREFQAFGDACNAGKRRLQIALDVVDQRL